jgi:hypothetical protein
MANSTKLTQYGVEVIQGNHVPVRLTQYGIEAIQADHVPVAMTQYGIEVLTVQGSGGTNIIENGWRLNRFDVRQRSEQHTGGKS